MKEIEAHINKLFEDVPESNRKNEIMQEITQNLNEKISDLIQKGQTKEQAIQKAIEDFGDIDDIKDELESGRKVSKSKKAGLALAFSIWGCLLILALVLFINFYYTPGTIWFVYPAFAVLWWPMSMFFHWLHLKNNTPVGFLYSVSSFVLILCLMLFINFYYTPQVIWFVYPTFGTVWWPLAMLFHKLRQKSRKDEMLDD